MNPLQSAGPSQILNHRSRATLLGSCAVLLIALASGCGDDGKEDRRRDLRAEIATTETRIREHLASVRSLTQAEWLSQVSFRNRLWKRTEDLDRWLSETASVSDTPEALEDLLKRGRAHYDAGGPNLIATLDALIALHPVADEVETTEKWVTAAFDNMKVDADLDFPLRAVSYQKGWLPQKQEALRFLQSGITQRLQGRGDMQLKIGVANVTKARDDGLELKRRVGLLIRDLEQIPNKTARSRFFVTWAERALAKIDADPDVIAVPRAQALRQALAEFRSAAPDLEAALTATRPGLLAEADDAKDRLDAAVKALEGAHRALLGVLRPIAAEIGVAAPAGK